MIQRLWQLHLSMQLLSSWKSHSLGMALLNPGGFTSHIHSNYTYMLRAEASDMKNFAPQ
jgi:hypothetical protein